jgi:hypothetical protein
MKTLIDCELEYFENPHLMQIYAGFFELEKLGLVNLRIKKARGIDQAFPVTHAYVNNKYKVTYDTLDGLTWVPGDATVNLEHFRANIRADFYFKRSYDPRMQDYLPDNCKAYPLGLNYNVHPGKSLLFLTKGTKAKIKYAFKTNRILKKISAKNFFYSRDFEYLPIKTREPKILFLTRLWSPDEAKSERSRLHRTRINEMRVQCIEACRKEYGKQFTGGLQEEPYASKHFRSLLMPAALTSKANYLQSVKDHSICIATTGLHNSIGWKLAEYVAASRAVVSEPLHFSLPGNFSSGQNYYEFENADQLLQRINTLTGDPGLMLGMMKNNYYYYNNFVKPENLILNTLLTVVNESNGNN